VSPHDGLGSNLIVQTKHDKVMRVLPLENEDINECWLADRDRFAYQALNSEDRVTRPMVREADRWIEVDWQKALAQAAGALKVIRETHGAEAIGFLASPHQTVEELALMAQLARGLGCENIDHRLDQADCPPMAGAPWLGTSIADLSLLDRVLRFERGTASDRPAPASGGETRR
jgi:NADH-quinone oxidoreductase subunit G